MIQAIPKMTLSFLSAVAFCFAVQVAAKGEPDKSQEETIQKALHNFTAIRADGVFDLVVDVGDNPSIRMQGIPSELKKIKMEVVGDTLMIKLESEAYKKETQSGFYSFKEHLSQIRITTPSLQRIDVRGVGSTTIKHIQASDLAVRYEGVGGMNLSGKVNYLDLKAEGIGAIDAKKLEAKIAKVRLDGVGGVSVYASEKLIAKVDGIGGLTYYGNPKTIEKTAEGLGDISAGK